MSSTTFAIGLVLLLASCLGLFIWFAVSSRFSLLKANGCYGLVAFGYSVFAIVGGILHKILTGIAAWGAIPWLLAILFGALPMFIWGVVAILRSGATPVRKVSILFFVISMAVPVWLVLQIISGR